MDWELITNIIVAISIIALGIFAILGLCQWITRKSLKKVDARLIWIPFSLLLMTGTYFFFDKIFVINTRPDGSGIPSFPSSHVMTVATIFFLLILALPKYVENRTTRIILEIIMVILISLVSIGRVLCGMHWPVDVVGALAFAFVFSEIYYLIIKKLEKGKPNAKHLHKNH